MSTSKKSAKKSRLSIESNMNAGVGYACVNGANGHTVFSGSTNDGSLLGSLSTLCKSNGYNWMTY